MKAYELEAELHKLSVEDKMKPVMVIENDYDEILTISVCDDFIVLE
jgi:hypothetical protein